ncbi:MAG: 4-hydroxy-tetrahydrodipicolinate reductase [Phenylobacterium sp.]|jgi:4-hydroxy-tetrahydrodipicolinate reductase
MMTSHETAADNKQTAIGIFGANGRMGRALIDAVDAEPTVNLSAAFVRTGSALAGIDSGTLIGHAANGTALSERRDKYDEVGTEVFIDFTLPDALEGHIAWCREQRKSMVIGTTGLTPGQLALIDDAAKDIAIVFAPNYSVGINLMLNLLKTTAAVIGNNCDIEIIEGHHRFKQDAPSGTALKLGEAVAETLGRDLSKCAIYGREGIEPQRSRETIGFSTIRAGDIVGEHTVMFADMGERLEITHKATSRLTFAKGAVRAALWLKNKPPGLYDMQTVLGLK